MSLKHFESLHTILLRLSSLVPLPPLHPYPVTWRLLSFSFSTELSLCCSAVLTPTPALVCCQPTGGHIIKKKKKDPDSSFPSGQQILIVPQLGVGFHIQRSHPLFWVSGWLELTTGLVGAARLYVHLPCCLENTVFFMLAPLLALRIFLSPLLQRPLSLGVSYRCLIWGWEFYNHLFSVCQPLG